MKSVADPPVAPSNGAPASRPPSARVPAHLPPTAEQCKAMRAACPSFCIRQAERAVADHFNQALAPCGITVTQIPVLASLRAMSRASVSRLAEVMLLDVSTLSRNLIVLQRMGLVQVEPGSDRRTRIVSLTRIGLRKLAEAYPRWAHAQKTFADRFEGAGYGEALQMLQKISRPPSHD